MEGGIILAYDHDRAIYPFVHSGHGLDSTMYSYFISVNRIDTTSVARDASFRIMRSHFDSNSLHARVASLDRRIKSVFHAKLLWKSESGEGCVRREGGAKGLLPNQSNF